MSEDTADREVVTTKKQALLNGTVVPKGKTVKVATKLAAWLVKEGLAVRGASGQPVADSNAGPSELDQWPGAEPLKAAGITTVAALTQLVNEKGDAWFKPISGIGAATAAEVIAKLTADKDTETSQDDETK